MILSQSNVPSTDWLASRPVFFDELSGLVSNDPGEIFRYASGRALNPEGLEIFFDLGYSGFGLTPVEGVRILGHSSSISRDEQGKLESTQHRDPFFDYAQSPLAEQQVIGLIRDKVQSWESNLPPEHQIIVPLSGGFDSRLLLWCLKDKSRVRAFSYGTSWRQASSIEVITAKEVAKSLDVSWEFIPLAGFNEYIPDWYELYGPATHAHGMYHIEFYSKIKSKLESPATVLSGVIGDLWAGSISVPEITSVDSLRLLGLSRGVTAEKSSLVKPASTMFREKFWEPIRADLVDWRFRLVTLVRTKMTLLNYLIRVPESLGFSTWSPFLDFEVAMAMIHLDEGRRSNREWQRDFFEREGILICPRVSSRNGRNNLNLYGLRQSPVPPLKKSVLDSVVSSDYIEWVNRCARYGWSASVRRMAYDFGPSRRMLKRHGLRNENWAAYNAYLILSPLQKYLEEACACVECSA